VKSKKLPCELCGTEVAIRSTIKTGDHKGKKACPFCKIAQDLPPIKLKSKFRSVTPKTRAKRKKEREDYPEFFETAIKELARSPWCQNCGGKIQVWSNPHHNIAHILPKQRYKSVATNQNNKLFLCASKDEQNACHERFDSGTSSMLEMTVFQLAVEKFKTFKEEVAENGKLFHILSEY